MGPQYGEFCMKSECIGCVLVVLALKCFKLYFLQFLFPFEAFNYSNICKRFVKILTTHTSLFILCSSCLNILFVQYSVLENLYQKDFKSIGLVSKHSFKGATYFCTLNFAAYQDIIAGSCWKLFKVAPLCLLPFDIRIFMR